MSQPRIRHLAAWSLHLIRTGRSWLIAFAMLAAPWSLAQAQSSASWNSLGPPGGTVLSLLQSPSLPTVLYAGTLQNGVFVSSDSGSTWVAANSGLPATTGSASSSVRTLVSDGQYLYAATDAGIFYTAVATQAGDVPSWAPMAMTGSATSISLLAVDPASGTLFAAGTGATMADAPVVYSMVIPPLGTPATTWVASALPSGTEGSIVGGLAVVPSIGATPATVMVGAGVRVFGASVPTGAVALSWFDEDPLAQFSAQGAIETLAYSADFSQAYACSGGQLFQATDPRNLSGPNSWNVYAITQTMSNALSCSAIASGPGLLAIATNLGVYAWKGDFTLSGAMNIVATKPLPVSTSANALLLTAGGTPTLYVGGGFGVSSQTVAALTSASVWAGSNGPASVSAGGNNNRLNNASVSDIAVLGTTLYAAIASLASQQYADVMVSINGGATWTSTGLSAVLGALVSIPPVLAVDATNSVVYAGTDQGLYALTGGHWVPVAAAAIPTVIAMVRDAGILYIGTDAGVFSLGLGPTPASAVAASAGLSTVRVTALHAAGGKLYAGTKDLNVSISSVSVAASVASGVPVWSDYAGAVGQQGSSVYSLAVAGTKLLAATRSNLVFIAEQGGAWTPATDGLSDPNGWVTSLISDGTNVYAATFSNGVFVASLADPSPNWMPFSGTGDHALPGLEVHQLRGNGTLLYAATSAGLAAYDGIVPITTPPVPPTVAPAANQDSGGGAADLWSLGGLLLMLGVMVATRRSRGRPEQ